MKTEPMITFRGVPEDAALEEKVRRRALRLERYYDGIQRCHVWVEAPHGHHLRGRLYEVRLRITVPDGEILVEGQPQNDDVQVAIRGAFDAARRQLEDYARRRRGDVKSHRRRATPPPAVEEGGA
ncbi:MAG: HPF/RaiA family ribosome-associated protein [Syntrophomonadaceae bacterium]